MDTTVDGNNIDNQNPNDGSREDASLPVENNQLGKAQNEQTDEDKPQLRACYTKKFLNVPYWWWPTNEVILWRLTVLLMLLLIWGAIWSSVGDYASPGGGLFNFIVVIMVAHYVSVIGTYCALPPLVGMLLVGVFFKNTDLIRVEGSVHPEILNQSRDIALTLVLIRAGLGLDPSALKKLSKVVPRLAFTPCLVEMTTIAFASHLILGLPIIWGFLMGSVLGAVSPAVTVHYLLALKEKGFGVEKGIPTLIVAASSIDDILAITLYGVISAIIFSTGSVAQKALRGPTEALIGLTFGSLLGIVAMYLPLKNVDNVALYRGIILASGSYFAVLGSHRFEMVGAGFMAAIVSSYVAAFGWRKKKWLEGGKPVQKGFTCAWLVMQHLLFTLIGYQLDFSHLKWDDAVLLLALLAIGLTVRIIATFIVVSGTGFNLKEHLFISIAWIPKATVQAALGPTALNLVEKFNRSEEERLYAQNILNLAVLGILITAPLGAIGILLTGPRLLEKKLEPEAAEEPETNDISSPTPPPQKCSLFSKCCGKKNDSEDYVTSYELHRDSILISTDGAEFHQYV
ncbi:sodium/hydrogen exchanger 9B2-like isoform X1 [Ischnura elegans]|uniref:sodium/hydrogen exchanger 9B2-like isoform X1 n=1 Tax=Ischnura elegans TaxID=197161 RepID=UPI001ED8A562|nr:sodium/hydrogen exchanger 9B2-like isoform X1 [Ischnura elegans]